MVTGVQGALLSPDLETVHVSSVTISLPPTVEAASDIHLRACKRALWERIHESLRCKGRDLCYAPFDAFWLTRLVGSRKGVTGDYIYWRAVSLRYRTMRGAFGYIQRV